MMPIALGFMYVEMQILDHVFIEEESRVLPQNTGFGPAPRHGVKRPRGFPNADHVTRSLRISIQSISHGP